MKKIIYKRILMTHDGSKLASKAIPHALSLSEYLNTDLVLLRVIESVDQELTTIDPMGMTPPIPAFGNNALKIVQADKGKAKKELEKIKVELNDLGTRKVETVILEGYPPYEIINYVKNKKIDLIIMSTHGRSGLGRIMLGSVTDYIVRHSPCPVLVIRAKK